MPAELHDRAADCWRPLLALADCVGAHWPALAREAAKELSGVTDDADQPAAVLLLGDVRTVFGAREELSSADLVNALQALDSRPWATWGKDTTGLTSNALARLLNDFGIHPSTLARHKAALLAMLAPVTEFVYLKSGLTVPLPALRLALDLEQRGFRMSLDHARQLQIDPGAGLTDTDRATIARWRLHLGAIVGYVPPEVS